MDEHPTGQPPLVDDLPEEQPPTPEPTSLVDDLPEEQPPTPEPTSLVDDLPEEQPPTPDPPAAAGSESRAEPELEPVPAEPEAVPGSGTDHAARLAAETGPTAEAGDAEEPAPQPPATVRRTIGQELVRRLRAAGVRYCFAVSTSSSEPLLVAFESAGLRVVRVGHGGAAALMAEAATQSTGRPQVVAVSGVMGTAEAAIGLLAAAQDSVAMLALAAGPASITGQEPSASGLIADLGGSVSAAGSIDRPDRVLSVLDKAWRRLHGGRPGPVLVAIASDLQDVEIELLDEQPPHPPGARGPAADRAGVSRAMKLLAASERGVVVAGAGVLRSRATKRLVAVSEVLAVPVIAAPQRPDVFPNDHANYLGMAGPGAAPTAPPRLADADVVLTIGTDPLGVTGQDSVVRPGQTWIDVDIEPRSVEQGRPVPSLSITADASRFLDSAWSDLRAVALDNEMRSRREVRTAADRAAYRAAATGGTRPGPGPDPYLVLGALRAALPDNAVVTSDGGNLAGLIARGFRFRRAGTYLGSTSSARGVGLSAAIAASLVDPDRITVAICDPSGLVATMGELETAVREGAHPIVVVLEGQIDGVSMDDRPGQGGSTASRPVPVDFAAAARAYGALGFTASSSAEFEAALHEAISARQTSVIHVSVGSAGSPVDTDR